MKDPMHKSACNFLGFGLTVLIFFSIQGCGTTMALLGDNVRYSISGTVNELNENTGIPLSSKETAIPNVNVSTSCKGFEKSVYQNRRGITDENGNFVLTGLWTLEGCSIGFSHDNYLPETVKIVESHRIHSEGLSIDYRVNVLLTRRIK